MGICDGEKEYVCCFYLLAGTPWFLRRFVIAFDFKSDLKNKKIILIMLYRLIKAVYECP